MSPVYQHPYYFYLPEPFPHLLGLGGTESCRCGLTPMRGYTPEAFAELPEMTMDKPSDIARLNLKVLFFF